MYLIIEFKHVFLFFCVKVEAVAYDNPIPGYGTGNTINLRLWAAKPSSESDLVGVYRTLAFGERFDLISVY
jgi:glucan phosphorylase